MRMGQIARQIGVSREAPLPRLVTLCRPDPSHIARVDPDDLASVSPIVLPISRNVRRCAAPVSANVRWKRDCASVTVRLRAATRNGRQHGSKDERGSW